MKSVESTGLSYSKHLVPRESQESWLSQCKGDVIHEICSSKAKAILEELATASIYKQALLNRRPDKYYAQLVLFLDRPREGFTAFRKDETFREFALANAINLARHIKSEEHAKQLTQAYTARERLGGMVDPDTLSDDTLVNATSWLLLKSSCMDRPLHMTTFFVSACASVLRSH